MFDKKFDLIVSMGEDCACALFLIKTDLRDASYPMDWLCNATFERRVDLICNHFQEFLQQKNMKWFPETSKGLRDLKNENYEDTATGFYFYHDFTSGIPFEEIYPSVKSKYERRILRFYKNIRKNRNILLVWWSRDKTIDNKTLRQAQEKISCYFGKDIHLLVIENDASCFNIREERVSDFVIKYVANIMGNLKTTTGEEATSMQIFKQIRCSKLYKIKLKKILLKYFCRFICLFVPIRRMRIQIRKIYK